MDYTVTHVTHYRYESPVSESVMEVRLGPRNDPSQETSEFELETTPAAALFKYVDAFGNDVHHFDITPPHQELLIRTRLRVRKSAGRTVPERLDSTAWDALARVRADGQLWDSFEPSPRVPVSAAVREFASACGLVRGSDPLTLLPSHRFGRSRRAGLRTAFDDGRHAHRCRPRDASRRLPGLRSRRTRARARARHSVPIRERLSRATR